ncbi:MAG: hypothetical protein KGN00_02215 [Chloroflexota bacterium]|nr:hypothetical protein [Chloroflexota bacterium]
MVGRVLSALTHRDPVRRTLTATGIAVVLWLGAWTVSYLAIGEGALRALVSARIPGGALDPGPSLAITIFSWNLVFGVGAIVVGSLFAFGPLSLGYFAPWWWALGYGVALGTNSFVLTVPGKLAPRIDILWQHIGAREILAYILVAAALSNIHLWRPRNWHAMALSRVRAIRDVRLGAAEAGCLVGAIALLLWSANVEAAGVMAFLQR